MESLGLGLTGNFRNIRKPGRPMGCYGKMAEVSKGKDSTSGHWEIMGVPVDRPFPVYPEGFPPDIISAFEKAIGEKILGNKPASGTEIIKELGQEHLRTGKPIVYTSADSVFQIAAHEDVIPLEKLYEICETARGILKHPHNIGRVIARPFTGSKGSFTRTPRRKDFSVPPFNKTALEYLAENGLDTVSVGKVIDIFAGKGFTDSLSASGNDDSVSKAIVSFKAIKKGIVFVTLTDFDTLFGHRNDPAGYVKALEDFDKRLSEILSLISEKDMLVITADHGCDPTVPGTDHTREYVPLLVYSPSVNSGTGLGTRNSFSDAGASILDAFGIRTGLVSGKSFWREISAH